ncbi:MAG: LCP family protein [Eggerthellaceae bacterium]|nr:LCP family protein [Eggerthellaceae bacterium]
MKLLKKILAFGAVACLALALAGCGSSAASSSASASASSAKSESLSVASEPVQEVKPVEYTEPFYVLVVGNDTRLGTVDIVKATWADGNARSDTMMLLRIDPKTYKITIVSIPRDTQAVVDGNRTKINEEYRYHGIEGLLGQVKSLTGVEPKYYLDMTFVNFEDFINQIGGVDVYVTDHMELQDIVGGDQVVLEEGDQTLNGVEALVFARMRKIYAQNQDGVRQIHDRAIVESLIKAVAANPSIASASVDTLLANCKSNWPKADLANLVTKFCQNAGKIEILSGTGPYTGDIDEEAGLWLATRDEDTWAEIINVVNNGGSPTEIVDLPTSPLK